MQTQKTLIEQMVGFFLSAFQFPGLGAGLALVAVGLGLAFGAIWLLGYWPDFRRRPILWAIGVVSAFLTWASVAFIQIPLQTWSGQALLHFWDEATLSQWLLLAGIPAILLSGIVQEAAKLAVVIPYWMRNGRRLSPRAGLIAGAVAGAGFGVFEAVWVHNTMFASGWTWQVVQTNGPFGLAGFWERFFAVGFHIAASALAGYGLARGKAWQFYIIAALLHSALNYSVVLLQKGIFNPVGVELYIAVLVVVLSTFTLPLSRKVANVPEELPDQDGTKPPATATEHPA